MGKKSIEEEKRIRILKGKTGFRRSGAERKIGKELMIKICEEKGITVGSEVINIHDKASGVYAVLEIGSYGVAIKREGFRKVEVHPNVLELANK